MNSETFIFSTDMASLVVADAVAAAELSTRPAQLVEEMLGDLQAESACQTLLSLATGRDGTYDVVVSFDRDCLTKGAPRQLLARVCLAIVSGRLSACGPEELTNRGAAHVYEAELDNGTYEVKLYRIPGAPRLH